MNIIQVSGWVIKEIFILVIYLILCTFSCYSFLMDIVAVYIKW